MPNPKTVNWKQVAHEVPPSNTDVLRAIMVYDEDTGELISKSIYTDRVLDCETMPGVIFWFSGDDVSPDDWWTEQINFPLEQ